MNINPISLTNINQNNIQSNKNPSFKKFCGIDKEFYSQCTADELKVLLNEAKNFAKSKFCDIKFVKGPYSTTYNVAVKLKNSSVLQKEPMVTKKGVCGKEHPINIDSIGWQIINGVSCPTYLPYYLDISDYDCPECNHYILPDIDEETRQVYEKTRSRLESEFSNPKYPYLKYAGDLKAGLAYAHAYEAYWTRQENEKTAKTNLKNEFANLAES